MISYLDKRKIMFTYPDACPSNSVEIKRYSNLFSNKYDLGKFVEPVCALDPDYLTLLPREFT